VGGVGGVGSGVTLGAGGIEGLGAGGTGGSGVGSGTSSRPQASKENSVPAVAALKPRATIFRMNSRRDNSITALP